jgi:hypothetical protein
MVNYSFYLVESLTILQAIKIALQKLNEGCSIEEAKAIFVSRKLFISFFTWKVQTSCSEYFYIALFRFIEV